MKIGEVPKVPWYIMQDGNVCSAHTAFKNDAEGKPTIVLGTFFAERKILPSRIAERLGFEYDLLLNATQEEVEANSAFELIKRVVEI